MQKAGKHFPAFTNMGTISRVRLCQLVHLGAIKGAHLRVGCFQITHIIRNHWAGPEVTGWSISGKKRQSDK